MKVGALGAEIRNCCMVVFQKRIEKALGKGREELSLGQFRVLWEPNKPKVDRRTLTCGEERSRDR